MDNEAKKMATSAKKNITAASIEELVNSSLDLAAEEVLSAEDEVSDAEPIPEVSAADGMESDMAEAMGAESVDSFDSLSEDVAAEAEEIDPSESVNAFASDEVDEEIESEWEAESEVQGVTDSDVAANEQAELETEAEIEAGEVSEPEPAIVQADPAGELAPYLSIEALETEVSELEAEIQIEMDKLVAKADHLKINIQTELKRVCAENEQLQQDVVRLERQLNAAEEKIQTLSDVQDRQQATIRKLIMILKGVNFKIAHLYDEK